MGAVRHHWSGQVFETPDGLGLIGLAPWNGPNVFVITGDSGMGMTHSTLGARLLTDLVMGRPSELAAVYSPSRWMPGALRSLLGAGLGMVVALIGLLRRLGHSASTTPPASAQALSDPTAMQLVANVGPARIGGRGMQ